MPAGFRPSLAQFGGKAANGCLAVSYSGLVWCMVLLSDNTFVTSTAILGNSRTRLKLVDICYKKSGELAIISSNGSIESPIKYHMISLKLSKLPYSEDKLNCQIVCQPHSSFYLDCAPSPPCFSSDYDYKYVDHLQFVTKDECDYSQSPLVVGISGPSSSSVELWECREKVLNLHRVFQSSDQNTNQISPIKKAVWHHISSANNDQPISSIALQKISLYSSSPCPCYIAIAFRDSTIKCYSRDSLQLIFQVTLNSPSARLNLANKFGVHQKPTSNASHGHIVNMHFSLCGCVLVALDAASQLCVYRVSPIPDSKNGFSSGFLQTMLEYCLFTGHDWWDVLVCVRPNLIDSLGESLTEAFNQRQTQAVQQKYMNRFLTIKASLYRLHSGASAANGQNKSGDCYTSIMLNAISNALKSQLRPPVNHDKERPVEFISNIIQGKGNDPPYFNVDKVLISLKEVHKDFFVESNILQSLQHLNQWIGDVSLFLLASLPQQFHNHFRFPGGGLISDLKSLNTLRELLVIIRIWGLLQENCLPMCTKLTKDVDVVASAFKLLSKAVATLGSESDETFLDECCSLPNQFLIPQLDLTLKARGVASPIMFNNNQLNFQYFADAPFLDYHIKTHVVDGTVNCKAGKKIDSIRHICLGSKRSSNESVRICTRCSALSLYTNYKSPSTKIWDSRWYSNCICGGNWKLGD
ncbi:mediator complex subunit 16 isoform X2 [Brevipalpus obovatus]